MVGSTPIDRVRSRRLSPFILRRFCPFTQADGSGFPLYRFDPVFDLPNVWPFMDS